MTFLTLWSLPFLWSLLRGRAIVLQLIFLGKFWFHLFKFTAHFIDKIIAQPPSISSLGEEVAELVAAVAWVGLA
jgi:hypothetical protein